MYINGYLCDVKNTGDGQVEIKLTKGYAAYDNSTDNSVVIYESETAAYSRQGADIKAESDIVTEYDTVIKETESQTSGEKSYNFWRNTGNDKGITGKKCKRYINT